MGELTGNRPKVLLPIHEVELLVLFPIQALAAAGVRNIALVVGYLANKLRRTIKDGN